jgi:DNA-binding MurR/RpiR family transcriptional regulator
MSADPAPRPELTLEQQLDVRVSDARGRLSRNDERILAFLREHLAELAFHTAESLAQGAGVSAAAVVRFSRRLGFASFRELRERARAELQSGREPGPVSAGEAQSTLERKVQRDIASLELLARMLEEPLAKASAVIAGADTTWFLANRETYGVAVYAQRLLHHVRGDVRLVDPSFPDPLRSIGAGDAVVACTFRPYARQTLALIDHVRAAGAHLILVTDGRGHGFIGSADVVLAVPGREPDDAAELHAGRLRARGARGAGGDARRRPHARHAGRHGVVCGRAEPGRRARLVNRPPARGRSDAIRLRGDGSSRSSCASTSNSLKSIQSSVMRPSAM